MNDSIFMYFAQSLPSHMGQGSQNSSSFPILTRKPTQQFFCSRFRSKPYKGFCRKPIKDIT